MPRTKVAKSTAKRVREGDDATEAKVKDFENRLTFVFQDMEYKFNEKYKKLDQELEVFSSSIPIEIQDLKIGELKRLAFPTFEEVLKFMQAEKNLNSTIQLDMSIRDDGYLTEASTTSSHHAASRRTAKKSGVLGPLDSARARSRRSRSAGALQTPSVLNSIRAKKPQSTIKPSAQPPSRHPPAHSLDDSMTSTASAATGRMSRSKYRTPNGKTKSASADRMGTITPKVKLGTPISILRFARMGETLLSTSGSPVSCPPALTDDANIAIPLADGVMSLRPGAMGEFDTNLLHRIAPSTLDQLKKLQENLNMVISKMDTVHRKL